MSLTPAEWGRMSWHARDAYRRRMMLVEIAREDVKAARRRAERDAQMRADLEDVRTAWTNPTRPYRDHGVWYVRIGNCELPFTTEAAALTFLATPALNGAAA